MHNKFRILITFLALFQCSMVFSQLSRVAQKVEQFKENGGSFKEITLTVKNPFPQVNTDGSLFELDRNQLAEL